MFNIALVGTGNIGSRHLQGLLTEDFNQIIFAVDPSEEAREIAAERIEKSELCKRVRFLDKVLVLPNNIDLAIIATNADIRFSVVKELVTLKKVARVILEKVVFQSVSQLEEVSELFSSKGVRAWVNCPRRPQNIYNLIRGLIKDGDNVSLHVQGEDWGIGCNSIHFLDLLAFLAKDYRMTIDTSGLEKQNIESKRKGFIKFVGSIKAVTSNMSEADLVCFPDRRGGEHIITVSSQSLRAFIREREGLALLSFADNGWKWEKTKCSLFLQSQLTGVIAKELLTRDDCGLTTYQESRMIHRSFLEGLSRHLFSDKSHHSSIVNIT